MSYEARHAKPFVWPASAVLCCAVLAAGGYATAKTLEPQPARADAPRVIVKHQVRTRVVYRTRTRVVHVDVPEPAATTAPPGNGAYSAQCVSDYGPKYPYLLDGHCESTP